MPGQPALFFPEANLLDHFSMKAPLKVAWVADELSLGGVTSVLLNHTRWLAQHGVQSTIYCTRPLEEWIAAQFSSPGVTLRRSVSLRKIAEDRIEGILTDLARLRPNCLVAFFGHETRELLRYAPRGIKRIAVVHSDIPDDYGSIPHHGPWLDSLVSVFRDLPKRLPADLPLGKRIEYTWLPGAVSDPGTVERRWPHSPGKLSVLYMGRLEKLQKRVLMLPSIAEQVKEAGVPVHFDVVGSGPERTNLLAGIRKMGFDDLITVHPPMRSEEVIRFMQAHDVFLLPSAWEGLPVSLMEAMSCRMAAVVSDLPSGIWEIVDRKSAMIVPMHGPDGYAEAIIRLWRDPDLGWQLGERAREIFLSRFSLEVLGPKWLGILGIDEAKPPVDIEWPGKVRIQQPLFVPGNLHRPAFRPLRRALAALTRKHPG